MRPALPLALLALLLLPFAPSGATGEDDRLPAASAPTYAHHAMPDVQVDQLLLSYGDDAGETSIVALPGNAAMLQIRAFTRHVQFDAALPPGAAWTDVTAPQTHFNLDPTLASDRVTGRVFFAGLEAGGSLVAYTDDAGKHWQHTYVTSLPSDDHPTIGAGPYPAGHALAGALAPSAVYYCATYPGAACARSDTGGLTWGVPVRLYELECHWQMGRLVVMDDGTVLVPVRGCASHPALFTSSDAGLTWTQHDVPLAASDYGDPALAVDDADRIYFIANDGGRASVTTSTDQGATWSAPFDLGAEFGILNARFPMAVAGDAGRAAVAFYGTKTGGDDQAVTFPGVWHLYVAHTEDGGATWRTFALTPDDPVQVGRICMQGLGCGSGRNLLDFQGMSADDRGRVLIGYADGCVKAACAAGTATPADSEASLPVIARQWAGRGLRAAFDPDDSSAPLTPSAGGPYAGRVDATIVLRAQAFGGVAPYAFAWDLDEDGAFDDATGAQTQLLPTAAGDLVVRVRVGDAAGASAVASALVHVDDALPPGDPILATWNFDAAGCAQAQGWTSEATLSGLDAPQEIGWQLRDLHPDSGRCSWQVGVDADPQTYYPYDIVARLLSPCLDLSALSHASFSFRVKGSLPTADLHRVLVRSCGGGFSAAMTIDRVQGGPLSDDEADFVGHTVDLASYAGGDVQIVFELRSENLLGWTNGHALDTFLLRGR